MEQGPDGGEEDGGEKVPLAAVKGGWGRRERAVMVAVVRRCRPESKFLTTIVILSDDLDRLYELCLSCLVS